MTSDRQKAFKKIKNTTRDICDTKRTKSFQEDKNGKESLMIIENYSKLFFKIC